MIPASVGFQCPECVREGNKSVRQARTVFGGRVTSDPGWVTKAIIGINVVVFVLQQSVTGFTARFVDFAPAVADGEYYRLLTSAFLHENVVHIGLNMYLLYLVGPPLEAALGRARFIALYLLSALGGSALSYAFAGPASFSLGASGAVFGLLGAYLVVSRRLGRDATPIIVLLVINLVFGFLVPNIDWRAHLGGLITGSLCAAAIAYAPENRRTAVQVGGFVVVAVMVVAVVLWRTAALT
jgi:membrane associated rhomboid family serine protease